MNPLKKAYCRTVQFGFRTAIPVLPYRQPALIEGFDQVAPVLSQHHVRRVLLVTDPGIYGLGLTAPLEKALGDAGIKVTVYKDTVANPTLKCVGEARHLYEKNHCDGLIAFGGGSAMDCAKAAGAFISHPKRSFRQIRGNLKLIHKLPLLIAVPTTAGTGSETTLAAVITDEKRKCKSIINDFHLIPDYAVMEPRVTVGLPPFLTATTGMDAMTHAVEAYIGRSTTRDTRKASVEAVCLIMRNLPKAYRDGTDLNARSHMLHASYLAGTAFTKSYVGYVHAVAHSLGGRYGIPHGLANSVLLPIVLREYGSAVWRPLADLALKTGLVSENLPCTDQEAAEIFIRKIEDMNRELGIPEKLSGIRSEDIPVLAKTADKEGNPLYPVPILWDAKKLETIYRLVQEEEE